jgi:hypothetical protein
MRYWPRRRRLQGSGQPVQFGPDQRLGKEDLRRRPDEHVGSGIGVHIDPARRFKRLKRRRHDISETEKPALEKAADKVNDVIEEIALTVADAAIEPDPEHVTGALNEQLYLPEASEVVAASDQSGRVTATADADDSPVKKAAKK